MNFQDVAETDYKYRCWIHRMTSLLFDAGLTGILGLAAAVDQW